MGDHVEKIDGVSLVNCRHFEVARMLKEIPVGTTLTLRAVEPLKAGFGEHLLITYLLGSFSNSSGLKK